MQLSLVNAAAKTLYCRLGKMQFGLVLGALNEAIRTKWVYRNKKDKRGVVARNKARLVAQGHRQEEGIDYDEVFALVARIESIRIFLAFSSYMGFIVYQIDVKSAYLYGKIIEKVYGQPLGFIDPKFPNKVNKVVKDLYGLHQAPKACSTKKSWCDEFEALMKNKFQMSSMGELTFFLGLQVKQKEDGIFISQDKYVTEILKKFDFHNVKIASTPIETKKPLVKDEEATDVDVHLYRSMIGSLMYLTASRTDIMVLALEIVKDAQVVKIIALKARIKKLEKECKPSISHHRACTLDDLDANHGMDTEETLNEGRLSEETKELVSTARPKDNIVRPDVGITDPIVPPTTTKLEMEKEKRQREQKASMAAIVEMYDEVQLRIEADALFAAKIQQEEREEYTIEERAKFLIETIVAQRKFRAAQRSVEIRSRPPTKSQLRNLMMTYLKNMGGYKYSQIKANTFSEIQGLYKRQNRVIDDFKPMDSDDAVDKEKVLKELDSIKIVPDEEAEVDYEVLNKRFPIINLESKFYHLDRHKAEMDLGELYNLVMQRFETTSLEGVDLVLCGDLRTMFKEIADDDLWKNQKEWILKSWNFYENYGVHTLRLEDGTEIYMLVERWYPLTKETLKRMLVLRLIAESESKAVFDLLRFIQKKIDEYGSYDGSKKDLSKRLLVKTSQICLRLIACQKLYGSQLTMLHSKELASPKQTAFDHQEKVLSMMDINEEDPTDVEEVLEVVKAAKLMTEVVTTAGATKVLTKDKGKAILIEEPKPLKRNSKREGESLEQEIAKKQKIEEETEELKKHLQIVTDNDVYTDATPLASNIPIVDYKIHTERNRPYFKIIRADGNHILQVEDESKMSLELLRLVRRQLNEEYVPQ
nr:putative ribonuclease H-like domain-containing protein [Tanacetum cinerariifolium]